MISIEEEGMEAAIKGMEEQTKELVQYMEDQIAVLVDDTADLATQRVPVDFGFLKNSIYKEAQGLTGEVGARMNYAPYVEFGTGGLVDVPAGLEDYAIQFKGSRKKKLNLTARPFLFNSAFEKLNEMKENLRRDGVIVSG